MEDAAVQTETLDKKQKKKKDKVRSAWISFVGRILAQMVGAIATVALGVMVLHRYTSTEMQPGAPNAVAAFGVPPAAFGQSSNSPVHVIVVTPAMLGLSATCTPALDAPTASAAHFDNSTLLSR